jgi:hypothetical protein
LLDGEIVQEEAFGAKLSTAAYASKLTLRPRSIYDPMQNGLLGKRRSNDIHAGVQYF